MSSVRHIVSPIWLPLFALAAVIGFYSLWGIFDLPPRNEVIQMASLYFDRYGFITILIAAIIEATLLLGWYFPGSLVIVVGVVIAGDDLHEVVGVFLATTLGFWIAHTFNYFVGKYGWYKLLAALGFREALAKAQAQVLRFGPRALFFTNFHPNLGALTATAAGILQMPFRLFLASMLVATILWDTFWTIIGYSFGAYSIELIGPKFVVPFIAVWIAVTLYFAWRKRKSELQKSIEASQV